jgi:hypothetical protein
VAESGGSLGNLAKAENLEVVNADVVSMFAVSLGLDRSDRALEIVEVGSIVRRQCSSVGCSRCHDSRRVDPSWWGKRSKAGFRMDQTINESARQQRDGPGRVAYA